MNGISIILVVMQLQLQYQRKYHEKITSSTALVFTITNGAENYCFCIWVQYKVEMLCWLYVYLKIHAFIDNKKWVFRAYLNSIRRTALVLQWSTTNPGIPFIRYIPLCIAVVIHLLLLGALYLPHTTARCFASCYLPHLLLQLALKSDASLKCLQAW